MFALIGVAVGAGITGVVSWIEQIRQFLHEIGARRNERDDGAEEWWYLTSRQQERVAKTKPGRTEELLDESEESVTAQLLDQEAASDKRSTYQCDGRVYCSQMTSCEEAEFFLANCPGVKMDGGGDGVPCEKQWCGDR
jgi:Excalibur calcium-binding domain